MKKIFVLICILCSVKMLSARSSLITLSGLNVSDLNTEQRSRYDKLNGLNLHVAGGLHLVTTSVPPQIEKDNAVTLNLPFLPCGSITFAASNVAFKDADNFSWSGKTIREKNSTCASGEMILQKNQGLFISNFTIDHFNYELYDLTGGVQLLLETNMGTDAKVECGTVTEGPMTPMDVTEGPCANIVTKVLILYSNTTMDLTTDVIGKANLAMQQTNEIWTNSGVNNYLSVAGIVKIDWNHYSTSQDELDNFSNSAYIQSLRDIYNAEIVVLLGPSYGTVFGQARFGGTYDDAYAVVNVAYATNGRYTFAHELNHLFGARHDIDNDPDPIPGGTAHGKWFYSGVLGLFHPRFTLMATPTANKVRIMHLSNPTIKYAGVYTGDWDKNNANQVSLMKNDVANFRNDPPLPFSASINMVNPLYCETNGTATALPTCGTPPYQYQWYTTSYPIGSSSWQTLGTTQSIGTYIPVSSYGLYSRAYKVVVTDAGSNVATVIKYSHSYCEEQQTWEPVEPFLAEGSNSGTNQPIVVENSSVGVSDRPKAKISPNPNKGEFNLELTGFVQEEVVIFLVDISGKMVTKLHDGVINGNQVIPVILDQKIAKGIYFVKIKGTATNLSKKVILN